MLGSNPSADSVASTDVGGSCGIPLSSADCESANHRERESSVKSWGRGGKTPADRASRPLPSEARPPSHNAWPNIQRILASLAQKDVTQATVVRKLSSYARQNQTKKALWELDNILRTIYILDFIDDPQLRQSVQKALNRGEAYHRMRRAISYVNSGKFRVKTEAEQQIWNECSRLIANAIIYYNTLLLSRVYEQKLTAGDQEAIKILRGTSPVAWRDVNLIGNFDFTTGTSLVDIEALAARYENKDFWRRSMQEGDEDRSEEHTSE